MTDYNMQLAKASQNTNPVADVGKRLNALMSSGEKNEKKIDAVAQDFEAVFLTQMVKHMYEGVDVDKNWGGGSAEETFRTLLFDEYGKSFAKAGGVGVAAAIKRQLLATQEV